MKSEPAYLHPEGAVHLEGTDGKFYWVPTVVAVKLKRHFDEKHAVELFAIQAEKADMSERVRGLENALRGMLSVAEHCDHYQKTNYRQCAESREAECALSGIYVGPCEDGRLIPGHGDPKGLSFICHKCEGFRGKGPCRACEGAAAQETTRERHE